jgi:hypothetical protein
MIRDNKLPPHSKQKKQYPHRHHNHRQAKQPSQPGQRNSSIQAAAKSTSEQKHGKSQPQPLYTRQAGRGHPNRKQKSQADNQINAIPHPHPASFSHASDRQTDARFYASTVVQHGMVDSIGTVEPPP